ncbi:MAG TPA: dihydrolipoamide dehydrogenase, partial [Cryomorphaceae bacterium]|nr:dihydrolipoamide dehydrogenase [Cryomorphaceae bacterium]
MKKWILSVLAIGMTAPCFAQELPQPSPTSTVQQRIGLTDVSVNYSRPSVNGRDIFGDLVPY